MDKMVRQELNEETFNAESLLDMASTIDSSGLFTRTTEFIPTLTFMSGPALGKEIPLVHRQLILGRGDGCDIMVPDPSVSRKHLQISCRKIVKSGEGSKLKVVVRDLQSRNGTLVNYAAVQRAVLKPGDKIIVGRIILKFDHRDLAEQSFYDEIYRMATTDSLTSLLNKASITRALSDEIAGGLRNRRWISVIVADIDEFKSLNDLYGHLMGDRVVQLAAGIFRTHLRRRDKVGRFGGDEFLIVLPETGSKGAYHAAEKLRKAIEVMVKEELGLPKSITLSLGVASSRTHEASAEGLLERADTALYRAKALGRNRAEICRKSRPEMRNQETGNGNR
jgi:two-component system, cell cycle response regulator